MGQSATNKIYSLYENIRYDSELHGEWRGSCILDILDEWFRSLGLETNPDKPATTMDEWLENGH